MAPDEPDTPPHHHVAQAGQQHLGPFVVEDDAPAEDQQVDQHEEVNARQFGGSRRSADGEWHQARQKVMSRLASQIPAIWGQMPA